MNPVLAGSPVAMPATGIDDDRGQAAGEHQPAPETPERIYARSETAVVVLEPQGPAAS